MGEVLLSVRDLRVSFGSASRPVPAVDGVSLDVQEGETVALVGESGCGKSVTALTLARLLPSPPVRSVSGGIHLAGRSVLEMTEQELRGMRGSAIAYVFQEPAAALNPVMRAGHQIREAVHARLRGREAEAEVRRLLGLVGLAADSRVAEAYPHELSGGMQQRVVIAMALAGRPRLLVADEPTTALDVTVQAQILELLLRLQQDLGMALLLITHNLGIVARAAHRVYVMYAGQVVESGPVEDVLRAPNHPYTRALMGAVPSLEKAAQRLEGIPGSVPPADSWPVGCRFHPRCARRRERCDTETPAWEEQQGRGVRCFWWR
jgi:peptide/nickel transport system ATP-binding protein